MVSLSTALLLALSTTVSAFKAGASGHSAKYSIVPGFFKQSDNSTDAKTFDYHDNLGLNDSLTWTEFKQQIDDLNANAELGVSYKVLYYARHGEGWHNVASDFYGDAFGCYYTNFETDGNMTWGPDPYLTEKGIEQAKNNSALIKSLIKDDFPLPQAFYSSPFTRCADTLNYTWYDIALAPGYATPVFKEVIREVLGGGTPDLRRDRAYLEERYPSWDFEANFPFNDTLYSPDWRETSAGLEWRGRFFLDDMFETEESTFISATSHGGIGTGIMAAAGHREFSLVTGAIIPMVIKREAKLDFTPVQIDLEGTPGPYSANVTACPASLSYTTLPASLASTVYTLGADTTGLPVVTVTSVVTASPTSA
ncbi:unnamed protein product [Ambrosiozyma monospora]|uniref:Unnamed protein product n=1 Tax=Ambrosiozyma monospora TaxID=43982 RepID=A0ACB5TCP4_AMBMO|nr:unnamed protein product [Ambrosiozyma monospora]